MNKHIATNMIRCNRSVKVAHRSGRRTTAREGAKHLKLKLKLMLVRLLLLLLPPPPLLPLPLLLLLDDKLLPPLESLQPLL